MCVCVFVCVCVRACVRVSICLYLCVCVCVYLSVCTICLSVLRCLSAFPSVPLSLKHTLVPFSADFGLTEYKRENLDSEPDLREDKIRKEERDAVYAAPETRSKVPVTVAASDVYSFAIIMVEVANQEDAYGVGWIACWRSRFIIYRSMRSRTKIIFERGSCEPNVLFLSSSSSILFQNNYHDHVHRQYFKPL